MSDNSPNLPPPTNPSVAAQLPADEPGTLDPPTRVQSPNEPPAFAARDGQPFPFSRFSPPPEYLRIPGYEILGELGRGGMGVVYKAWQPQLKRLVALKMIRSGSHVEAEQLARFRTEAEAVARLTHPNIVQIYEIGERDSLPYFSLEFVDGGNLDSKLNGRPIPVRPAAELVETLARAVHYAHQRGVLHRDLKPANVLLQIAPSRLPTDKNTTLPSSESAFWNLQSAIPKITDFGLAKRLDIDGGLTESGFVLGTPSYMAPEQASGHAKGIGPAVDIYALGVILYELLTGRPPFYSEHTLDMLLQVINEEPLHPSRLRAKVPVDLETICLKCLQKEPHKRYATAEELADDLRRFLNQEPIHARAIGRAERLWRWCRRKPALAGLSAALVLVALTAFGLVTWKWRESQANFERSESNYQFAQEQRQLAEKNENELRRNLYLSDLDRVPQVCNVGQISRAVDFLNRHHPKPEQSDLRGFEWYWLWGLCHQEKATRGDLPEKVFAVAYSPDGQTLASACADGTVLLWDARTWTKRASLSTRPSAQALAFAPDGQALAVGCSFPNRRGEIQLWDVQTQQRKAVWADSGVTALAFSPDGHILAAGCWDNQLSLWDVKTAQRRKLHGHQNEIWCVAFAPDGRTVASAGVDRLIHIWDPATGVELRKMPGHTSSIWSLAFTPDGKTLASGGDDRTVCLWDLETGKLRSSTRVDKWSIRGLAFAPNGQTLAFACLQVGQSSEIRLWDLATRREHTLWGHTDAVAALAISPDGKTLVSGGHDHALRFWDARPSPWNQLREPQPGLNAPIIFALAPDGRTLACAEQKTIKLWDLSTGREQATLEGHALPVQALAFAPDGQTLASGEGQPLSSKDGALPESSPGVIKLWDCATGKERSTLRGHAHGIYALAFSPDGRLLAAGGGRSNQAGEVKLWDLGTHQERLTLRGEEYPFRTVAFAPDGKCVAAGSGDIWSNLSSKVWLWDPITGNEIVPPLKGHRGPIHTVVFAPNGRTLATSSQDSTVKLWDLATGQERLRLRGHQASVWGLAFTPDGRRLVSNGMDRTVKVWDPVEGIEQASLAGNLDAGGNVLISADGQLMVTGGVTGDKNGGIRLWHARR